MADAALAETSIALAVPSAGAAEQRLRPALTWGGLGFLLGAIFWHCVGFWTFVADVVFTGRAGEVPIAAVRRNDERNGAGPGGVSPAAPATTSCINLVLDRRASVTRPRPCSAADAVLPHAGFGRRQDHAIPEARGAAFTPVRASRTAHGDRSDLPGM